MIAAPGAMECFIVALLFLQIPNPAQRETKPYFNLRIHVQAGRSGDLRIHQLRFGVTAAARSFPTESSTPLMNCTDSGAENLRAISSASLITTGRGV
jgi:hypothetical protein